MAEKNPQLFVDVNFRGNPRTATKGMRGALNSLGAAVSSNVAAGMVKGFDSPQVQQALENLRGQAVKEAVKLQQRREKQASTLLKQAEKTKDAQVRFAKEAEAASRAAQASAAKNAAEGFRQLKELRPATLNGLQQVRDLAKASAKDQLAFSKLTRTQQKEAAKTLATLQVEKKLRDQIAASLTKAGRGNQAAFIQEQNKATNDLISSLSGITNLQKQAALIEKQKTAELKKQAALQKEQEKLAQKQANSQRKRITEATRAREAQEKQLKRLLDRQRELNRQLPAGQRVAAPSRLQGTTAALSQAQRNIDIQKERLRNIKRIDQAEKDAHKGRMQRIREAREAERRLVKAREIRRGRDILRRSGGDFSRLQAGEIRSARTALTAQLRQADIRGATKRIDELNDALARLNKRSKVVGQGLGQLTLLLRQFFRFAIGYQTLTGLLNLFKDLGRSVVDLDKELRSIQAISGATIEQMKGIETAVKQVALTTKFTTNEIAKATKVLAQAGTAANEMGSALKAVAQFASATDSSLETAADLVTTFRRVFKDLDDQAIANQLTKSINISKLTAEDLKVVLSISGQVAKDFALSSEQYLAAVTTLRNAGIKASTVATGLRQGLTELFVPDNKTLKALETRYVEIGERLSRAEIKARFATYRSADNPLLAAIGELRRIGFAGEGQRTLGRGFNIRAVNALSALVKNYEQLAANEKKVTFGQAAAEASEIQMKSLANSLDNLGAAFTVFGDAVFGGGVESLQVFTDKVTEAIQELVKFDTELKASGAGGGIGSVLANAGLAGTATGVFAGKGLRGKAIGGAVGGTLGVSGALGLTKTDIDPETVANITKVALLVASLIPLVRAFKGIGKAFGNARLATAALTTGRVGLAAKIGTRLIPGIGTLLLAIEGILFITSIWPESESEKLKKRAEAARKKAVDSQSALEKRLEFIEEFSLELAKEGTTAAGFLDFERTVEKFQFNLDKVFGELLPKQAQEAQRLLLQIAKSVSSGQRERLTKELQKVTGASNLTDKAVSELANEALLVNSQLESYANQINEKFIKLNDELLEAKEADRPEEELEVLRRRIAAFTSNQDLLEILRGTSTDSANEQRATLRQFIQDFEKSEGDISQAQAEARQARIEANSAVLIEAVKREYESPTAKEAGVEKAVSTLKDSLNDIEKLTSENIEEVVAGLDAAIAELEAGDKEAAKRRRRGGGSGTLGVRVGDYIGSPSESASLANLRARRAEEQKRLQQIRAQEAKAEEERAALRLGDIQAFLKEAAEEGFAERAKKAGISDFDISEILNQVEATEGGKNVDRILLGKDGQLQIDGPTAKRLLKTAKRFDEGVQKRLKTDKDQFQLSESERLEKLQAGFAEDDALSVNDFETARSAGNKRRQLEAKQLELKIDEQKLAVERLAGAENSVDNLDKLRKAEEKLVSLKEQEARQQRKHNDEVNKLRKKQNAFLAKTTQETLTNTLADITTGIGSGQDFRNRQAQFATLQKQALDALKQKLKDDGLNQDQINREIATRKDLIHSLAAQTSVIDALNAADERRVSNKSRELKLEQGVTTGNLGQDARRRATGIGFSRGQRIDFQERQRELIQFELDIKKSREADLQADIAAASKDEERLVLTKELESVQSNIIDLKMQEADVTEEIAREQTRIVDQLQIAFSRQGLANALDQSSNSVKNYGNTIRNSVVSAWDSVGDAITDAIISGEDFGESMKRIVNDLSNDILRTTIKTGLNNILGDILDPSGQSDAGGNKGNIFTAIGGLLGFGKKEGGGTTPADDTAKENSGILTGIAGALGLGDAGEGQSDKVKIQAKQVIVEGPVTQGGQGFGVGGGTESLGDSAGGFGQFFESIGNIFTGEGEGFLANLGGAFSGLLSGIGNFFGGGGFGDLEVSENQDTATLLSIIAGVFGSGGGGAGARTGGVVQKFAGGGVFGGKVSRKGIIKGRGTGTSDSVAGIAFGGNGAAPIAVSAGEAILTAKAVDMLGENFVHAVNSGAKTKMATGGMVADSQSTTGAANTGIQNFITQAAPSQQSAPDIKINNILDPSVTEEFMESRTGENAIMNVLRKNGIIG